ncbi:unnamed protein product [Pleuronectes platessa]|uniref:Discs, large (Drosophila) homolog-associated protein 2a n=1 Tax=Pleuronectes platessa TaxID=8262 RepID=A0A9N7VGQ6_PLEPL|nr:unnamed protein product [Pleuronectes platessa]
MPACPRPSSITNMKLILFSCCGPFALPLTQSIGGRLAERLRTHFLAANSFPPAWAGLGNQQASPKDPEDIFHHQGETPRPAADVCSPTQRNTFRVDWNVKTGRTGFSLASRPQFYRFFVWTLPHGSRPGSDKQSVTLVLLGRELWPRGPVRVEAATDSESESKSSPEYHSVGIQVEDDKKGQGRFKRSNSVTAAVQADMELECFPTMEDKGLQFGGGFQRHSEPSTPTQYGAVRTVRTQGLFSYREDYRTPTEPPSPRETTSEATWQLEPPSQRESAVSSVESGRASPSLRRDGSWFMQLLHTETKRIEGWCKEMEAEAEENDLSEDILGKIRSAVGSAQLLMSQKFQQFYWLCQQNLVRTQPQSVTPSAMPRPTSQDLAGFWDLLQLSVDDVTMKFDQLQHIKNNNWRPGDSPEKKPPAPLPKKTVRQRSLVTREKSLDLPDRHRQEARRRLMAAKRAASFRQNSASERADSIEIYIPEAQTRL